MKNTPTLAKITRPRVKGLLSRERLFFCLDEDAAQSTFWVCGPGGSGKTAFLSSYIEARKCPALWYRLDEGDADPASFFYYLGLAVKQAAPSRKQPLPLLTPEYLPALPVFSRNFFRDLYSHLNPPFLIVIDDYHAVPSGSALDDILLQAFKEIPEGIQMVVLSRLEPPATLSRMHMNGALFRLNWDRLRFTPEETEALIKEKKEGKMLSATTVRQLHERTNGWVAGLLLMLRSKGLGSEMTGPLVHQSSEALFDYFTVEVLREMDLDERDFLYKTPFLPRMTVEMADRVSGSEGAKEILRRLTHSNFFIERDTAEIPVYRYHDLFRAYLLTHAKEKMTEEEKNGLIHLSATTLEGQGWREDALALFITAKNWPKTIALILNLAPMVSAQGRFPVLNRWLFALPEKVAAENPWLIYWQGICALVADLNMAKKLFAQAYERFKEEGNKVGLFLAWSGVAEAIFFEWSDFTQMDRWIDEIAFLFETDPVFPSKEIEIRVMNSFVTALSYRKPAHPKRLIFVKRLQALVEQPIDNNLLVMPFNILCWTYQVMGEGEMLRRANHDLNQLLNRPDVHPLQKIFGYNTQVFVSFFYNEHCALQQAVEKGLSLSKESGIHFTDILIYTNGAVGSIIVSDMETARIYLKEAELLLDHRKLNTGYYHFAKSLESLTKRKYAQALTEGELSLRFSLEAGTIFSELVVRVLISQIFIEQKQFEKAEAQQQRAMQIAKQMKSAHFEYVALLLQSQLETAKGNEVEGIKHLRHALSLSRKGAFFCHVAWYAPAMARLCAKALEAGIEVEYVQSMIRKHNLIPDRPPLDIADWPWKIKVTTLGAFSVEIDGKLLRFKHKARQKPLDLLKTLIALGGEEVKEEKLADILWPETDGDKALQSLASNLHRLREMIGQGAIVRKRSRLSLNRHILWCDVWALERLIENWEDTLSEAGRRKIITKIRSLYQGPFLNEESDLPEIMRFRDKLSDQVQRYLAAYRGRPI